MFSGAQVVFFCLPLFLSFYLTHTWFLSDRVWPGTFFIKLQIQGLRVGFILNLVSAVKQFAVPLISNEALATVNILFGWSNLLLPVNVWTSFGV